MKASLNNFLYFIKQIVAGKNGAGTSANGTLGSKAADGGITVDWPLEPTVLVNSSQAPAITDSTGGTPSATFAAIAAGGAYAQADMVAVKNALSEIALILNAQNRANSFINSNKQSSYTTASGTNGTIGVLTFPIPRDYDEASDNMRIRLFAVLQNADANITITGTPTITPISTGVAVTGSTVTGTAPFKTTPQNLSTTEQVIEVNLSQLGLLRDSILSVTFAFVGTTTGNLNILALDVTYDSTIVSYNETDATGDPDVGGNLIGFGNPLR
jgi:hypothetical protein